MSRTAGIDEAHPMAPLGADRARTNTIVEKSVKEIESPLLRKYEEKASGD
jgi:hypothetical protein